MADWQKIKVEFITTDISLRALAEKNQIRYATVQARYKKEGWAELRDQHRISTVSKSVSKIADRQADNLARIEWITDKLLVKLEKAVEELDLEIIKKKVKVETEGYEETTERLEAQKGGIVDRAGLRNLTAALKDLKEIQMIKSELDRREQEARIANLQRQAEKDDDGSDEVEVIFGSEDARRWAK